MFTTKMKIKELDTITFEVRMSGSDAAKLIALEEELDKGGYQFDVKFIDNRQAFYALCCGLRNDLKKLGLWE